MDDQHTIRASDQDREKVVDRLAGALEDGRLKMDEYVDRMGLAYQAVTYGDLAPLCADLPPASPVTAEPVIEHAAPAGKVYAVASGHCKIVKVQHKPADQAVAVPHPALLHCHGHAAGSLPPSGPRSRMR
jgi:hypothetical protein